VMVMTPDGLVIKVIRSALAGQRITHYGPPSRE
jgi:hypothetical protein